MKFWSLMLISALLCTNVSAEMEHMFGVDDNKDQFSISLDLEHEESAGTYQHRFGSFLWIQGGGAIKDRWGFTVQKPFSRRFTLHTGLGFTKELSYSRQTRDMSGYDFNATGHYWRVGITYVPD